MRALFFVVLIFLSSIGTLNVFLKNPILGSVATISQASPQSFVFAQVKGIEHFASKASIEFSYQDDSKQVVEITPQLYQSTKGWLSFRRAYLGIPLFYSSNFLYDGQKQTAEQILKYGYCDGPLIDEMALPRQVVKFELVIQAQTTQDDRVWKFEYICP